MQRKFTILLLTAFLIITVPECIRANSYSSEEQKLLLTIKKACPKKWENLQSDISVKSSVLDIWEGDLTDKAQFIQYANADDGDGNKRLIDKDGKLLIDSYNDVVTIMTECGAQRVKYYKFVRANIASHIGKMVSKLTGQTAFDKKSITSGVDYDGWLDGIEIDTNKQQKIVNLAIGKNTTQSGTSSDDLSDTETTLSESEYAKLAEKQGYAVKAVDNNIDGNFANGSVTHTGFQNQPYWEVDLAKMSELTSITLYNRVDCCQNRLSNLSVLIGTRPIDARSLTQAKGLTWVKTVVSGQAVSTGSRTFTLPKGTRGRYVRIQLAGNNQALSLAEVKVMGHVIEKKL